jgi:hypothetical protein
MGAHVSIAGDQRPLGRSAAEVVTVDESGNELAREVVPDERGLVLHVVHFLDLDDGGRITTEAFGDMRLSVPRDCTVNELRDEVGSSSARTSFARSTRSWLMNRAGRTCPRSSESTASCRR